MTILNQDRKMARAVLLCLGMTVATTSTNSPLHQVSAFVPTTTTRFHASSSMVYSPLRDLTSSHSRMRRVATRVHSTNEKVEIGPVFEDVDGIGELTSTIPVPVIAEATAFEPAIAPTNIEDTEQILSIADEATSQLLNPTSIVVEEIMGTALSDPDVNGSLHIPTHSLKLPTETEEEKIEAPRLSKIFKFAIPAVGVWLCSPLLSLIDTSSVGLLSGTAQQAALNPAVAVTDYGALLVAFMYTATTNLVAGAKESEKDMEEKPQTTNTLIHALQLSGFVGVFLGSVLSIFAPVLLKGIIGNDAIDPVVFAAALRYVRIRALGMPAAVIIGSAQSACLGLQDVRSPMYVLLAAAIVNFIGDMLFVPSANPWLGGAAGAAWATVFSQYAALAMFIKWLKTKRKPATVNVTKAILELTGKSNEGEPRRMKFRKALQKRSFQAWGNSDATSEKKNKFVSKFFQKVKSREPSIATDSFSTRGFLADKFQGRKLLQFPPIENAKEFWPFVLPVTTTSVGRVSAYVAMSHVVSSSLGTLSMAANQVILSVFYCMCPFCDSLNLTAQSFIPGIFQKKKGPARTDALNQSVKNFMKAGVICGATSAAIVSLVPILSKYFTTDPLVIAQVNSVVPLLSAIFAIHGVICAGEGLLLGQKDLGYLGKAYGAYFFAVPFFMLRLKNMALSGIKVVNLSSLWEVFFVYQIVRAVVWVARLRLLGKRSIRQNELPVPVSA